jgi:hypothetical protein
MQLFHTSQPLADVDKLFHADYCCENGHQDVEFQALLQLSVSTVEERKNESVISSTGHYDEEDLVSVV